MDRSRCTRVSSHFVGTLVLIWSIVGSFSVVCFTPVDLSESARDLVPINGASSHAYNELDYDIIIPTHRTKGRDRLEDEGTYPTKFDVLLITNLRFCPGRREQVSFHEFNLSHRLSRASGFQRRSISRIECRTYRCYKNAFLSFSPC